MTGPTLHTDSDEHTCRICGVKRVGLVAVNGTRWFCGVCLPGADIAALVERAAERDSGWREELTA